MNRSTGGSTGKKKSTWQWSKKCKRDLNQMKCLLPVNQMNRRVKIPLKEVLRYVFIVCSKVNMISFVKISVKITLFHSEIMRQLMPCMHHASAQTAPWMDIIFLFCFSHYKHHTLQFMMELCNIRCQPVWNVVRKWARGPTNAFRSLH